MSEIIQGGSMPAFDGPEERPDGGGLRGPVTPKGRKRRSTKATGWRVPADQVPQKSISEELTTDVVILGHGYAGITCCRELAESGVPCILLEAQTEERMNPIGKDMATINSKIAAARGVPPIDTVEYFNNWIMNTNNTCNQTLISKYVNNNGENIDWYLSVCSKEELESFPISYFPRTDSLRQNMLSDVNGLKFYVGTITGSSKMLNQKDIHRYNRDLCRSLGAKFIFDVEAQQLVTNEDGAVIGVLAQKSDMSYLKVTAKAVVL